MGPRQTDNINQMIPLTKSHLGWLTVLRPGLGYLRKIDPINHDDAKKQLAVLSVCSQRTQQLEYIVTSVTKVHLMICFAFSQR